MDVACVALAYELDQPRMEVDFTGTVGSIRPIAAKHDQHVLSQAFPYLGGKFVSGVARNGPMKVEVDQAERHEIT